MRGTVTKTCMTTRAVVLRIWQMQARGPPWLEIQPPRG